ncbi:CDP-diacylglycerol--serine O-phosphatidyltransferase [Bradyrhizobium sp. USDA 3262]
MTPFDPNSTEYRRRRFRPIPVRMLVPNMITLLAICAGLTAIRLSTEGRMELAVAAIVFAAILDGIDGRVARMIKGQSKFGAELDSLADFVNFGVAPGLILYFWQLHELNNGGWIAAMVFAISGGLRLARFNASIDDPNKPAFAANYFTGVPAPAGAITVLLPIYLAFLGVPMPPATLTAFYTLLIAFLMVSRLPVFSRQDREDARAAGNGAAGVRCRGVLRRAADRLSLAHPVGGLGCLFDQPALGLEVLSRPGAPACRADASCGRAGAGRCCSLCGAGRGERSRRSSDASALMPLYDPSS